MSTLVAVDDCISGCRCLH